ncbi:hypothetical protein ILUMI_21624 [Ignelater luminosus]|uniref:Uncharacterized protein n=1 Tax=Ignelater luminosus TaxID=2038154 RepID=A0A8K0G191_IGNLU|nr:hypothetical protein ILUMI_21624 [Ignelater luminosus]
MPVTCKTTTTQEWDSTNTSKAIEAVTTQSLRNAAKEFEQKKFRLAYLMKKVREDSIDKVALATNYKQSATSPAEMKTSLMEFILK